MKFLDFYKRSLNCHTPDEVFDYFVKNLKPSILLWGYFVNWEKVLKNTRQIELALNELNYLIGKDNFDDEFRYLIKQRPELALTLPALTVRDGDNTNNFKILVDYTNKKLIYQDYDFSIKKPTDEDIEKFLLFVTKTGLKDIISSRKVSNLVDYMIGVEAGLDSNGRKNRGGTAMENIVGFFVAAFCNAHSFKFISEANAKKIKKEWQIEVPVDKSSRRYDFVINAGTKLVFIETNFYGSKGSKLKATAGEYKGLQKVFNPDEHQFIWVTDGKGWISTRLPLEEVFNANDHIINLDMLEKGILEELV